ncbi:MAG: nucleotide exchange factor GrpE [Anaerolineaceae bacterium]|jgi:molecular chaperone GrpE
MTDDLNREKDPIQGSEKHSPKHSHPKTEIHTDVPELVQVRAAELTQMKHECEKAQKDAAHNLDGWQRERAEFSNYKKRIDREQEQLRQTLTGSIIKKYLVVLDDIDRALKHKPETGEGAAWAEGIELIERKLLAILDSEGIERIDQNRVQFDPNIHEAISNENNPDFESGEVIEVVQHGYKLGDRILRPAMVRVAR